VLWKSGLCTQKEAEETRNVLKLQQDIAEKISSEIDMEILRDLFQAYTS
jgi:hypothetical protein